MGPGPGPAREGWGEMAPRTEDCTDYGAFGRTPLGIWRFLILLENLGAARGGGEGKGVRGRLGGKFGEAGWEAGEKLGGAGGTLGGFKLGVVINADEINVSDLITSPHEILCAYAG